MSQKGESKPSFEDFQNIKSLLSSPDLSKPKDLDPEPYNFKENNDKPYLSEQAKLLLDELHKYKATYKPNSKENLINEPSKQFLNT